MDAFTPRDDDPSWMPYQRALVDACFRQRVPFRWHGPGTFLIDIGGAAGVIEAVTLRGFKVLALEGFEIEGLVIHPRIDLLWDVERSPDSAFDALKRFGPGIWVDISLA